MTSAGQDSLNSGFKMTKRLLGEILVDGQFIAPKHLEAAIQQQKQSNDQLGEILVRMGVLDPVELNAVLSIQKDLASPEAAVKLAAGVRDLLGDLLLKARRLTKKQVDQALQEQQRTGEKIGEALVRLGFLKASELDAVLAFQRHQSETAAASAKLRLGEILVATGQITREQLEDSLRRQKSSGKNIGDLLVEAGYAKRHEVDRCVKLQQKLVTAALIAALSMSGLFSAKNAQAGTSGTSEAKVTVSATVRQHVSMQVLNQAHELVVTNADIRRGYVEVAAASRINVKTNNTAGCLLAFEVADGPGGIFNAVFVRVGGREVQLSSAGGWIQQPYIRGGVIEDVSYRFALSKEAQPGTYNWPLMISVHAL